MDVDERFDGDVERFDNGDKPAGRKVILTLFEPLFTDKPALPLSELSVHAPSEATDSSSISVLILFFE